MVDRNLWIKAIENVGIVLPSPQDFDNLFYIYDQDKDGLIDYRAFAFSVFHKNYSPSKVHYFQESKIDQAQSLILNLKSQFLGKGIKGLIGLVWEFASTLKSGANFIGINDFRKVLDRSRIKFTELEIQNLFQIFDTEKQNKLNIDEFIQKIKGELPHDRKRILINIFNQIDHEKIGSVQYSLLRKSFQANFNPEVLSKKYKEEEYVQTFIEALDCYHCNIMKLDYESFVNENEFLDFFSYISPCYSSDDYFKELVSSMWRSLYASEEKKEIKKSKKRAKVIKEIPKQNEIIPSILLSASKSPKKPLSTNQEISASIVLDTLRARINARGIKGIIGLAKLFRTYDPGFTGMIHLSLLPKVFQDYRIDFFEHEKESLVKFYFSDPDKFNFIEFLKDLRGNLNEERIGLIEFTFKKLDKYNKGVLELHDVKVNFSAKTHPEVKMRKRTEADVFEEFNDALEMNHYYFTLMNDPRITKEEFIEFYSNISAAIEDYILFENLLIGSWKLTGDTPIRLSANYPPQKIPNIKETEFKVYTYAPYGTYENVNDYQTSNKLKAPKIDIKKIRPAGVPSAIIDYTRPITSPKLVNIKESVFNNIRLLLFKGGVRNILTLHRYYLKIDTAKSGYLNFGQIVEGINKCLRHMPEKITKDLLNQIEQKNLDKIDYMIIIKNIIGNLSEFRNNIVVNAFRFLDKNDSGLIPLEFLRESFSTSRHPLVVLGTRTEEQILSEFLDILDGYHLIYNGLNSQYVDFEEFIGLHTIFSTMFLDDLTFKNFVSYSWNLDLVPIAKVNNTTKKV